MNECAKFQDNISAYFDGELSETDAAGFEAHLEVCKDCSSYLEIYSEISKTINGSFVEAPDALSAGVMDKIIRGDAEADSGRIETRAGVPGVSQADTPTEALTEAPTDGQAITRAEILAEEQTAARTASNMKKFKVVNIILTRYLPAAACLAFLLLTIPRLFGTNGLFNAQENASAPMYAPSPSSAGGSSGSTYGSAPSAAPGGGGADEEYRKEFGLEQPESAFDMYDNYGETGRYPIGGDNSDSDLRAATEPEPPSATASSAPAPYPATEDAPDMSSSGSTATSGSGDSEPDTPQPGASGQDASQPDAQQPEASPNDTPELETSQSEATESGGAQPDDAQLDEAQLEGHQPGLATPEEGNVPEPPPGATLESDPDEQVTAASEPDDQAGERFPIKDSEIALMDPEGDRNESLKGAYNVIWITGDFPTILAGYEPVSISDSGVKCYEIPLDVAETLIAQISSNERNTVKIEDGDDNGTYSIANYMP